MPYEYLKEQVKVNREIDKTYLWKKARLDRRLVLVLGVLAGPVMVFAIVKNLLNPATNVVTTYVLILAVVVLFVFYCIIVKCIDDKTNYINTAGKEYRYKCIVETKNLLIKYNIVTICQMRTFLDEIEEIMNRKGIPDKYIRTISFAMSTLIIPAAFFLFGQAIKEASIREQTLLFSAVACVGISVLILSVMTVGGLQELFMWKYERIRNDIRTVIYEWEKDGKN